MLGVTHDFDVWTSKIKTNDNYLSKLHSELGVTHDFDTWKQKVIGSTTPSVPSDYKPKEDFSDWEVVTNVDDLSVSMFRNPEGDLVKDKDVPRELQDLYKKWQTKGQDDPISFGQFLVDTKGTEEGKDIIKTIDSYKLVGTDLENKRKENKSEVERYKELVKKRADLNLRVQKAGIVEEEAPIVNFAGLRMIDPSAGEVTGNIISQSDKKSKSEKASGAEIERQNKTEDRESLIAQIENSRVKRIYNEVLSTKSDNVITGSDEFWDLVTEKMTDEDAQAHFKKLIDEAIEKDQGIFQLFISKSQQEQISKTEEQLPKIQKALKNNIKSTQYSYNNIIRLEKELTDFQNDYNEFVAPKATQYKKEFEDIALKIENLEKDKEALGDVNEYSDISLINQWNAINDKQNVLITQQQGIQVKQEKLLADNADMISSYKKANEDIKTWVKDYKDRIVISDELIQNEKDLLIYHNAIKRNNHNVVAGSAWLLNGAISLTSGVEGMVNAVRELPEDLLFEYYDNDVEKMPPIVKQLKGYDVFTDAMRMAGKEKVNNFMNNINNSVEEAVDFEEVDDVADFGMFALHGLANFAPQVALMATTGGASIYVMGASAFGNKYDEMERSNAFGGTEYTLGEKWLASTITGGSEVLSEKITYGIFKGYNNAVKSTIRDKGFKGLMQNFSIGGTLKAGTNTVTEGGSEVLAQIGGNFADIIIGKDVDIMGGVNGAFVTGLIMERAMAMPVLYNKISPVFMGKDYTEQMASLNIKQNDIGKKIINELTSESAREKLTTQWLKIQEKKETLMAKNIENINMMKGEEKNRLVNIENNLFRIRNEIRSIEQDGTIKQSDKDALIEDLNSEQQELSTEKNKIIQKYESDETREARYKRFEEQTAKIKANIERSNKRRKSPYISERFQSDNKYTEFETTQEGLDYFNNKKMEQDAQLEAEIRAMREVLNSDVASERDKRIAAQNIKFLQQQRANTTQEAKSDAKSYGFIIQNADGSFEVVVNKENALAKDGNINVAAHEFLHAVLYKSLQANTKLQSKIGNAVVDYVEKNKGGLNQSFINKMTPYAYADNAGEEIITVMSESIMDGSLQFNDGFFTKIGDLIRQNLQRLGWKKIKFNTGRDVYNFIKDYNASIEKNYNSEAIDRLMDFGAEGSLVQLDKKVDNAPKQNIQKSTLDGFQNEIIIEELGLKDETAAIVKRNEEIEKKILEEGLKDSEGNIMASISLANALVRNNMPRAFALARKAANKGKDLTLEDGLRMDDVAEWFSQFNEKLVKLSRTYRARKNGKEVPFGAYMNAILPKKYSGILESMKGKIETARIEEETVAKKVAKKIAPKIDDGREELEGTVIALEQMGHGDIMPKLQNIYNENKNQVKKLSTYKDVKNAIYRAKKEGPFYQALVEVAEIFTNQNFTAEELAKRILNKQDLTKEMRKAIQDKILKHSPEMITMVPDGTTVGGDATGIANTKLGVWYTKQGRSKFTDTGTGKGLAVQQKQGLNNETFRQPFGIAIKGQRVTDKSVDGALREWVMQVATLAMNQASRQADPKNIPLLKIKEGKSRVQFSTKQRAKKLEEQASYKTNKLLAPKETVTIENEDKTGKIEVKIITRRDLEQYQDEKNEITWEEFYMNQILDFLDEFPQYYEVMATGLTGGIKKAAFFNIPYFRDKIEKYAKKSGRENIVEKIDNTKQIKPSRLLYHKNSMFKGLKNINLSKDEGKIEFLIQFFKDIAKHGKGEEIFQELLTHLGFDQSNFMRHAGTLLAFPVNAKGKEVTNEIGVEEHDPQMEMARILFAAARDGNIEDAIKLLRFSYSQSSLRKQDDPGGDLRQSRGKDFFEKVVPRVLNNELDFLPDGFGAIYRFMKAGVNPNAYKLVKEKQTIAEYFGVDNLSVKQAQQAIIDVFEGKQDINVLRMQSEIKYSRDIDSNHMFSRAVNKSRVVNDAKGITVLDFDDTLATTKSLVKFTRPDGTTGTLNAEEYASTYEDLLDQGFTFDFSDFNKVVKGKIAPLFQKALKLQGKFGPENMFVLTARPPQAAKAIFDFLKANGLNIPMKNITGLANSTAEAKALWVADKVGEGFNDFYFADDALQNVQAVKNMLDQFDVKSKIQQAKTQFSKPENLDKSFNDILENITGIESKKRFSAIKARKRGEKKGRFRFFIPPSHEDFVGLLYNFIGKGKEGNAHRDFFEQALIRPLNRAYRELNTAKQSIANDYKSLNKQFEDIKKKLTKKTPDGDFSYQDAIRIYLWDKHGYKIPGLSKTDQQGLVDLVKSDSKLQAYADAINTISKRDDYVSPAESWEAGDIRTDLDDATGRIGRAEFFAEFFENADIIFSQENLNKIEAVYGANMVSALKDILYRTKTGRNRPSGQNKLVNQFLNYLNGSVASTMFFNIRSAVLQQMSMVNFINYSDNNILSAAKAFANQKQYWTDWATIFNSNFMKQRRGGIKTDVNGAELAATVKDAKNPINAAIKKLLELGFLPTQIGDNIAIATGGSTFYRNRINTYLKEGMTQKEAESKAWTDFQVLAEATQQSARPDMVSQQQASPLGKVILAFQNVTSQFNRLGKKAFLDIKNRRITPGNPTQLQSDISNLSRIAYYFAIQNLIFYTLQSALFMAMFDDNEEDEKWLKKKERMVNGSIDSVLRGTGVWGAAVATLKNMAIKWHEQRDKGWNKDESAVLMEMLNLSPPLGIKARKMVNAEKTLNYNKKTIDEMSAFDIDNPIWSAVTSYTEATTNVPLNRLYNKTINVRESLDNQHNSLQRVLMFSGWSKWNLGIEDIERSKGKQKFTKRKSTRKKTGSKFKAK